MGNKVLKGNKDEEFKVKLGNQYLLLNKATTAENLQAFDIQVDNGKKEILGIKIFTEEIDKDDIETIEDSVYSYIDANYLDEGMDFSEFTILVEDVLAESGYDYEFLDTCEINI